MTDQTMPAAIPGDETPGGEPIADVAQARDVLVDTIERAGLEHQAGGRGEADDLQKVGAGGVSFELRLNGMTIALDGQDVNELGPDDFKGFLERARSAVQDGSLDATIERALAKDGPGKAIARVRALDPK